MVVSTTAQRQPWTVTEAMDAIKYRLGGDVNALLDPNEIVNEAGELLAQMNDWEWLNVRSARIDKRAMITWTTGATWTEGTLTLSLPAGTLDDYTLLPGDVVDIESGTDTKIGQYKIESVSTDDLVLDRSLQTTGGTASAILGRMDNDTSALPDDFQAIVPPAAISATDSLIDGVYLTSQMDILRRRTNQVDVTSNWNFYGVVTWSGSPPIPLLEVYPRSTTDQPAQFTVFYKRGWKRVNAPTDKVDIPPYCRPLFREILMAVAKGRARPEQYGEVYQLLDPIYESREFMVAIEHDGMIQPTHGRLRGGQVKSMPRGHRHRLISTEVDSPT